MYNNDPDDWFDSDLNNKDIERQIAENDQIQLQEKLSKEGYREGLVRITEDQEKLLQSKGYEDGYNSAKNQFKIMQTIEIVLMNEALFPQELFEKCKALKQQSNYEQIKFEQLLKN